MKCKPAFLLVEWMVQCGVLTLLVIITLTVTITWYKNIARDHQLFSYTLPLYVATDVMRVDVHNAHKISLENDQLQLIHQHTIYVWYIVRNQLMRSLMRYDPRDHRWLKPAVAMIASYVMSSQWERIAYQRVFTGLSVLLQDKHSSVQAILATRNELII